MSENKANVQPVLESFFTSALNKITNGKEQKMFSDLFVQVDSESGEVLLFDDEERLLEKTIIFDWVNSPDGEEDFQKKVTPILRAVFSILATKNIFDSLNFIKPFSVSLTNEDFLVLEELLFIDDDTLLLDDPLLKDLDAELDEFLAKLLSDVE